jgi:hypothetical protein
MELLRAMVIATVVLLAAYSLLPEQYRFSRGIIVFGSLFAFILISVQRWILTRTGVLEAHNEKEKSGATVVVGSREEYDEVLQLLREAGLHQQVLGRISTGQDESASLGNINDLETISARIPFRHVIFCQGELSFAAIIAHLQKMPPGLTARIHAKGSGGIVTSKSKENSGEIVSGETALKLASPYNLRLKRLADVIIAFVMLITFPLHLFFVKRPFSFYANCFLVLLNRRTWIGYTFEEGHLPKIKRGVISCNGMPVAANAALSRESLHMVNYWYARDYEPAQDIKMILRRYRLLGS